MSTETTVRTDTTTGAESTRTTDAVGAPPQASGSAPTRLLRLLCAAYTRWLGMTSHRVLTASRSSRWGYLGMVATGQVGNEDCLPA